MPKAQRKRATFAASGTRGAKRAVKRTTTAGKSEWWLSADIEVCVFCHQGYAYGSGYRCPGCDSAVCIFCVEHRSGKSFCPEC